MRAARASRRSPPQAVSRTASADRRLRRRHRHTGLRRWRAEPEPHFVSAAHWCLGGRPDPIHAVQNERRASELAEVDAAMLTDDLRGLRGSRLRQFLKSGASAPKPCLRPPCCRPSPAALAAFYGAWLVVALADVAPCVPRPLQAQVPAPADSVMAPARPAAWAAARPSTATAAWQSPHQPL